jgi:hypothetical protein
MASQMTDLGCIPYNQSMNFGFDICTTSNGYQKSGCILNISSFLNTTVLEEPLSFDFLKRTFFERR